MRPDINALYIANMCSDWKVISVFFKFSVSSSGLIKLIHARETRQNTSCLLRGPLLDSLTEVISVGSSYLLLFPYLSSYGYKTVHRCAELKYKITNSVY